MTFKKWFKNVGYIKSTDKFDEGLCSRVYIREAWKQSWLNAFKELQSLEYDKN